MGEGNTYDNRKSAVSRVRARVFKTLIFILQIVTGIEIGIVTEIGIETATGVTDRGLAITNEEADLEAEVGTGIAVGNAVAREVRKSPSHVAGNLRCTGMFRRQASNISLRYSIKLCKVTNLSIEWLVSKANDGNVRCAALRCVTLRYVTLRYRSRSIENARL